MIQGRKTPYRVSLAGPLLCGAVLCAWSAQAQEADPAAPTTPAVEPAAVAKPKGLLGPSARIAAELKKEPPQAPSWVAHYLPDDRYKVAGGIWKYVSTELDTYYHLPNSPLMLRQPNNIVIGFSSREMAEEAGYRPDPAIEAQIAASSAQPAGPAGPKLYAKATTITINDGQSKATVPANWRYYPMDLPGVRLSIFLPKGTKFNAAQFRTEQERKPASVVIVTRSYPVTFNIENLLQPDMVARLLSQRDQAMAGMASQNASFEGRALDAGNLDISPSNWGGARALRIRPKKGPTLSFGANSIIVAARGSKTFSFYDWTKNSKGAVQIRNSFVAR